MTERIRCALCRFCEWHHGVPGRCIYGGPYSGYRLPDGTNEVPDLSGKEASDYAPAFET